MGFGVSTQPIRNLPYPDPRLIAWLPHKQSEGERCRRLQPANSTEQSKDLPLSPTSLPGTPTSKAQAQVPRAQAREQHRAIKQSALSGDEGCDACRLQPALKL